MKRLLTTALATVTTAAGVVIPSVLPSAESPSAWAASPTPPHVKVQSDPNPNTVVPIPPNTRTQSGLRYQGPMAGTPLGGASIRQSNPAFYHEDRDLKEFKPGDILGQRRISYHALGLKLPVNVIQIRYRTTDAQGRPSVGVTSVVRPNGKPNGKLVSYHSVYDSLNPEHSPSRAIEGDLALGTFSSGMETAVLIPFLAQGYSVAIPDIEGQKADFAAGPEYGQVTLDGIRAALNSKRLRLGAKAKVGLLGYSGGAIATNWAAQLAPKYAPDLQPNLVGAATGGTLVNPIHDVKYINGSPLWAGVLPMAVTGLARAYDLDLDPYLSPYGKRIMTKLRNASLFEVHAQFGGITYESMFKPEYKDPRSVPGLVDVLNKVNMNLAPNPKMPFMIGQTNGGFVDGTMPGPRGIGKGDGVMVTGDVRSIAHKYCSAGNRVLYREYELLPHTSAFALWYPEATVWLMDRFAGRPAPTSCGHIPRGNNLGALTQVKPAPKNPKAHQPQPGGIARIRDQINL
ncbi:secretory lipase [Corynebacterium resistens DSM 45100]|uniref:Secretory lipase n=1 Tax=Corynebacterium resistens (strain DSM 45100 / JCM 12819 / GTC 2026 / SICGH 158) TaxID=662755 RepID=F8E3B7_CORRG|nr:lipase family protein [Corynebacterium resistens]AEI10443.1 secretory lipase [Corynebacterium resistens DSM 45100]